GWLEIVCGLDSLEGETVPEGIVLVDRLEDAANRAWDIGAQTHAGRRQRNRLPHCEALSVRQFAGNHDLHPFACGLLLWRLWGRALDEMQIRKQLGIVECV